MLKGFLCLLDLCHKRCCIPVRSNCACWQSATPKVQSTANGTISRRVKTLRDMIHQQHTCMLTGSDTLLQDKDLLHWRPQPHYSQTKYQLLHRCIHGSGSHSSTLHHVCLATSRSPVCKQGALASKWHTQGNGANEWYRVDACSSSPGGPVLED